MNKNKLADLSAIVMMLVTVIFSGVQAGEIHKAALSGDFDKVKTLLTQDSKLISSVDIDKRQPLIWAASGGHLNIANLLLAKGADVDARTPWDGTALHVAANNGRAEVVKALISYGAKVDAPGPLGTPLHSAAYNGHVEVATILLAAGGSVSLQDQNGCSAFQVAATNRQFKYALFLLNHGESIDVRDSRNRTPLEDALLAENLERASFLLKHKANVNADDGQPLRSAIRSGSVEILQLVLKYNPNLNVADKLGDTPLHWAVRAPQYIDSGPTAEDLRRQESICNRIVPILLSQPGININARNLDGRTPLALVAARGFKTVEGLLAKRGAIK